MNTQKHLQSGTQWLAGSALEVGTQQLPGLPPALGRSAGHGGIAVWVFLDEFHVAVASVFATLGELCLDPVFIG